MMMINTDKSWSSQSLNLKRLDCEKVMEKMERI